MKKLVFVAILVLLACGFKCVSDNEPESRITRVANSTQRMTRHLSDVRKLIASNSKFNDKIAFLIDMKIPSGKNRFFVYNLETDKITNQGLVAHGSGSETGTIGKLKFSNIANTNSTSIGKYSIGYSYNGRFGKAYKLHGLDNTNSNAFDRNVVLHKFEKVPYDEQSTPICNSLGCPMVNEKYFSRIENILDNSKKPIVLYIYY